MVMDIRTEKYIINDTNEKFYIGDEVSIKFKNGGGIGSCTITKITDSGFHFTQDGKRNKSVQYKEILGLAYHNIRVKENELTEEKKKAIDEAYSEQAKEILQQAIRGEEQICCNCEDAMRSDICESCSVYRSISDLKRELEELSSKGDSTGNKMKIYNINIRESAG